MLMVKVLCKTISNTTFHYLKKKNSHLKYKDFSLRSLRKREENQERSYYSSDKSR